MQVQRKNTLEKRSDLWMEKYVPLFIREYIRSFGSFLVETCRRFAKSHLASAGAYSSVVEACIPSLTSSLIITWSSTFIPVLTQDKQNYNISEDEANWLPIISALGCLPSVFFFKIPDLIGRKYSLLLLSVPQAAYWIIIIFARDIYSLCVARFIGGLCDAVLYAALPIYLGEVTTPKIRGTWGNGQTFSFNAGFFFMCAIGSYATIQLSSYLFVSLPIISATAFLWLPESPYYYIIKGQDERARDSLQWLLRKKNIDSDYHQLKKDVDRQISETGTWADLFKIKSNRKALIACVFIRWSQQLAGIFVFEGYFQFIFKKAGSTALSPEVSSMVFSGTLWFIMTGFSFTLDSFGRRKSFIFSSLGCALCLMIESGYFYLDEFRTDVDLAQIQWVPIVGLILYVFFYCFGLGILPSLMAGELFSASIKGKGLAFANTMMGVVMVIATYIFKILTSAVGLYAPFACFAIFTLISFGLSFYIVPETKGKTLEEIQQHLKHSKTF